MKKVRVILVMMIVLFGVLISMQSCNNPLTDDIMTSPRSLEYEIPDVPAAIGDPDSPLSVPLLTKQSIELGSVTVWIEEDILSICFTTTMNLAETHLDVELHPSEFPQTKKGNPIPGHFAYKTSHDPAVSTYTYEIPMSDFGDAEVLFFAAHAALEEWVDGVQTSCESTWAAGFDFPGANWATYFAAAVPAEPAYEDGTVTIVLTGFPEASGHRSLIGLMLHGADPTDMNNLLAMGGFDIVDGAGSGTLSPWELGGTEDPPDWIGTGGETYDLYFWIDLNDNSETIQYPEPEEDATALQFPYVFTVDGNMILYFTGDDFQLPTVPEADIVGVWLIDQTYAMYFDDVLTIEYITQNITIMMNADGTYFYYGTSKWDFATETNTVEGDGTYIWDESAGTLILNESNFIMDGTPYPATSRTYNCEISATEMILTMPTAEPYTPAEPLIYTRQ